MKRNPTLLLMVAAMIAFSGFSQDAEKPKHQNKGFMGMNGYYDTREFSVLTINLLAKLPHRFQYFSLTNYQGPSETSDLANYYSEHNLRWAISKTAPFDITYQYILRMGAGNDDHRLGARWRVSNTPKLDSLFKKLNMFYSMNPMFVQFREKTETKYMTLVEHVYKINILPKKLNNRVYLAGFADQNFIYTDGKLTFKWVTEHQLGIKIIDQFYAVAEFRINDFLPSENEGFGYGLQYKIIF